MDVGAAMFFTDYSMMPDTLGQALEARGFESVWAPEHSHIPSPRRSRPASGGELPSAASDTVLPILDRWAGFVRRLGM
jgi:alkanesulfonate monooxygenase SsuD/methylene tetrahydromethanopterin reductase-like flavin-dependent oxidoreductase (luciferase family)